MLYSLLWGRRSDPAWRRAAPALLEGGTTVSYAELAELVRARRLDLEAQLGVEAGGRRVVVLQGTRTVDTVVTYLALLAGGHVPLLTAGHAGRLAEHWDAAASVVVDGDGVLVHPRAAAPVELHRDLALLLPTSGSTGAPKVVRLSRENIVANAEAIAAYLALGPGDRAITSLPLHYCYGLSVLHSHLAVGASVVLTESSVVDPCFRTAFERHRPTSLAGVPHTFELLERAGWSWLADGSLRTVTQAGGRLAPDAVRRWCERTEGFGASFYVMYGQTEATARMAYLPPELARRRPECIGRAIPGGVLRLRPLGSAAAGADGPPDDGAVGELVYRGPNVMMGYAECRSELARGAGSRELLTGDVARYHADDDVFELLGRRSRFVKPFGVRVDLDALERLAATLAPALPATGGAAALPSGEVAAVGDDRRLLVVAAGVPDAQRLRVALADQLGLPASCLAVEGGGPLPRTASGKVDYAALAARLPADPPASHVSPALPVRTGAAEAPPAVAAVRAACAGALGRADVDPSRSFVGLGGDSLSYVEAAVRLEQLLGPLPADWHLRPLAELAARAAPAGAAGVPRTRWRRTARLDTTIVLRALAIAMVVAYHMGVARVPGGAHLLLAVAGYNFARFVLPIEDPGQRLRAALRTASRVAVPAVVWLGAGLVLFGAYRPQMVLLVNNYTGPPQSFFEGGWAYWFFEVFVHLVVASALLLTLGPVARLERRIPYAFPLALLAGALAVRSWWALPQGWHFSFYRTHSVAWFFFLGWLIARSDGARRRALTAALVLATVPGFFHSPRKEGFIVVAALALLAWRTLPVPAALARPVSVLASASMWNYLTHFELWPRLADLLGGPRPAYGPTVLCGVAAWWTVRRLTARLAQHRAAAAAQRTAPAPAAQVRAAAAPAAPPSAPSTPSSSVSSSSTGRQPAASDTATRVPIGTGSR